MENNRAPQQFGFAMTAAGNTDNKSPGTHCRGAASVET